MSNHLNLAFSGINTTPARHWFDMVHSDLDVDALKLGRLTDDPAASTFRMYSMFREGTNSLNGLQSQPGAAWNVNLPSSFPQAMPHGQAVGISLGLDTTATNPPLEGQIFADLDRGSFSEDYSYAVARLFDPQPLVPLTETLAFLTDVHQSLDGTELRISVRETPRQGFQASYALDTDAERELIRNLLSSWQGRTFVLPIWPEAASLSSAITAADTTLSLSSVANADWRVGDLVMITDGTTTETKELASIDTGANTLTLTAGTTNPFGLRARVMPCRDAVIVGDVSGQRYALGQQELGITWQVVDNGPNLGDVSGWSSLEGSVLFDDCNVLQGTTLQETFTVDTVQFDPGQGELYQDQVAPTNRRRQRKGFRAVGKAGLWKLRTLLHALRGRQQSVWLPTFCNDLVLSSTIARNDRTLVVEDRGYSRYAAKASDRNVIRITHSLGTAYATIVGATDNGDGTETLLAAEDFASAIDPANVTRIDFVERVRLSSDNVTLNHEPGGRIVHLFVDVETVND